jgi:hypothetical protein
VAAEPPRYFTPAEAEALLPEVDRLLERAQDLLTQFEQVQRTNGHAHRVQAKLNSVVDEIQSRGVIVRDVRSGLIDFPALRDNQEIYLCWRRGEPLRIEWWHPTSTGIAGRQRL